MRRAACAALILAGCVRPKPPDPAAGLRAMAEALSRPDPRDALARLSTQARARLSEKEVGAAWSASSVERAQTADRLRAAAGKRAFSVRAAVESGPQVSELILEDERWRVVSVRPTARGAATPEEALRRFTAALEAHDLDALLQLLGEPLKSLVERELGERLTGLRAAAGQPVATDGDHAHIHYDTRHHVDLRRENGQWQVVDFN